MFGHHQYPANFLDSDIGLLIIYLQLQANLRTLTESEAVRPCSNLMSLSPSF